MNYCKMENLKEFSLEFLKRKKVLVLVIITVFFKVLQTFNLWVKVTWNLIIYILIFILIHFDTFPSMEW